jgi:exonuclease VII large subunit
MIVPDRKDVLLAIGERLDDVHAWMDQYLDTRRIEVERRRARIQQLTPIRDIERRQRAAEMLRLRALSAIRRRVEQANHRVEARSLQLAVLNPSAVLSRGFAAIETTDRGARLRHVASIRAEDAVRIIMHDGSVVVRTPKGEAT